MQRLKRFFVRVKESIYSRAWYHKLPTVRFRYSLKYYFVLIFFVAIISSIVFSCVASPLLKKGYQEVITHNDIANYPADLVITVKDGVATSSQPTPFMVAYTPTDEKERSENPDLKNIVVIDTSGPADLAKFREYHTAGLIASDAFMVISGDHGREIRVYPLSTFPNTTISKENIEKTIATIDKYLWLVWPALLVLNIIGVLFVYLAFLLEFLFIACLVWLLFKLMKIKMGYKKSYQYVLHAATLPILIMLVEALFPFKIVFWGMTPIVVLLITYINMRTPGSTTATMPSVVGKKEEPLEPPTEI